MAAMAFLGLIVFFAPTHIARYVVVQELDRMGIAHDGTGTIEIDLWEQEASFGPVRLGMDGEEPGQVGRFGLKLRLWNLFSRRAVLDSVVVEGVNVRIRRAESGKITVNGITAEMFSSDSAAAPGETEEGAAWGAALERLEFRNSRLVFVQAGSGEAVIDVERLSLNGFRTWEPDKPGSFDLSSRINNIDLKARGKARPFANRVTIALQAEVGGAELSKIEQFTGPLELQRRNGVIAGTLGGEAVLFDDGRIESSLKARFSIDGMDIAPTDGVSLAANKASATFDGKIEAGNDGTQKVLADLTLKGTALAFTAKDPERMKAETVAIAIADLSATFSPGSSISIEARPKIRVDGFKIDGPQEVSFEVADIVLKSLSLAGVPADLALKLAGSVNANRLTAKISGPQAIGASVGGMVLDIRDLEARFGDGETQWKARLDFSADKNSLSVSDGRSATITTRKLSIRDILANHQRQTSINKISISGLEAALTEKVIGSHPDASGNAAAGKDAALDGSRKAEPTGTIKINNFSISDDARISFKDASVSPLIDVKIAVEKFEIGAIDSDNLSTRSSVDLKAKLNEFTGINVVGWAAPFGVKPDFDLKVGITGLELPRFSAYAAKFAGMHLETGQLNAQATAKATDANLDANVKVDVKDLKFEAVSAEAEKKLANKAGMPVQTAVGLLQDSDNLISLTLPVRGTLAEPDIDLSDAIGKAVGGALVSLFPPTALAAMLVSAGKSGIEFKPIPYESGSAKLGSQATSYVDSLVELLTQRPKLTVRVCGRSTAEDLAHFAAQELGKRKAAQKISRPKEKPAAKIGTEEKSPIAQQPVPLKGKALLKAAAPGLSTLALERTRAIRRHLLRKNRSLGTRVSECRSVFNPKDKKPPRVEVSL
jgi:hypothetical protein